MRKSTGNFNEHVLQDFRLGKEAAFDVVYYDLYAALCFFCLQITGDKLAAQDIAEETFIKAWEYRHSIRDPRSWLYRVARNGSLHWLKQESRRHAFEIEMAANAQAADNFAWEALLQTEIIRQLDAAMDKLPPQRQRVVRMLYKEGKTVKEVFIKDQSYYDWMMKGEFATDTKNVITRLRLRDFNKV